MHACVCVCGVFQVLSVCMQILSSLIFMCVRDRFFCVRVITGKGRTVTRWAYTTFTQAVNCELRKCVGSMSRELGFTTLEQGSRGGLYVFYTSTSSSPPHLFSICLSHSLPPLSVCLLPDSKVCQELNLPPFLPSAAGRQVFPPPPQAMLRNWCFCHKPQM